MQRRLTLAFVGIALASVLLVGAGVLILAQLGARNQTEAELTERLEFLARVYTEGLSTPGQAIGLDRARQALGLEDIRLVVVEPGGEVTTLEPQPVRGRGRPTLGPGEVILLLGPRQLETFAAGETAFVSSGNDVIALRPMPVLAPIDPASLGDRTVALLGRRAVVTIGRQARVWFLVSAGAVLGASALAAWLLARRISEPLQQIEQATSAIAAGDFATRVGLTGNDELAQLGRSVNEMARDLERSKALDQQFILSVSHDLRTPLTAIAGYAEALSDGAVENTGVTGDIIASNARRLERLVGDLLDLAKLDANRFTLQLEPVDAGVTVGRTVAGLLPRARRHGVEIRFDNPAPAPVVVMADADRLGQAVGNLIDNAITFARSEILASVAGNGSTARITISDDGPGIAEEDLPHVFERLYVASSQPARAENPSGLGLAIVRELTTAMGGSVRAEANDGAGTRMTLELPMAPPPLAQG